MFPKEASERDEAAYIPNGSVWMQDTVRKFCPDENMVCTQAGKKVGYDFLVVAAGIQIDWDTVKGLKEHIGQHAICSNYAYETVSYTWECIQNFKGGNALFTQPSTPIKCGGAPQKIMYLADDHFRTSGVQDQTQITFVSGLGGIFPVTKYANALNTVIDRKGIETCYKHDLVEIRPQAKEAVFKSLESGEEVVRPYDMIHVTPPMSAPNCIKNSSLANEAGWVDVDKTTLQHTRYPNVFSLGDASSLPTSKTGAAIRKQAPTLVQNLLAVMQGQALQAQYDGLSEILNHVDTGITGERLGEHTGGAAMYVQDQGVPAAGLVVDRVGQQPLDLELSVL